MDAGEIRQRLLSFLESLPSSRGGDLAQNLKNLDSLDLLQVVVHLETEYGLNLAAEGVEPDDLRSLDGLVAIVERAQQ
jgi:acyl carrier protein